MSGFPPGVFPEPSGIGPKLLPQRRRFGEVSSMAALLRLVGPAVARYFDPGPDDLIDSFFDGIPMPVTVEVYPFQPATRITGQKLLINGAARDFTGVSGQNPTSLQFTLGGDVGETAGAINMAI